MNLAAIRSYSVGDVVRAREDLWYASPRGLEVPRGTVGKVTGTACAGYLPTIVWEGHAQGVQTSCDSLEPIPS